MNLGDPDVHFVNHSQPSLQHSLSRHSIALSNGNCSRSEADYASDAESVTTADTVIRWSTPPKNNHQSRENTQSEATVRPIRINTSQATDAIPKIATHAVANSAEVLLDERQIQSGVDEASASVRMFEFDPISPTPSSDDTPYIRFAIDQITRDGDVEASESPDTGTSGDSFPAERVIPDEGQSYAQSVRKVRGAPTVNIAPAAAQSEQFIPVEPPLHSIKYPNLRFRPMVLRTLPMIIVLFLCLVMITALMFCAIYSGYHDGLVQYASGLTNAQYFLFEFLPQIFAVTIFVYIECVMSAVVRVVPFTMMASNDQKQRSNALFVGLYTRSFLWPRFDYHSAGEPLLCICSVLLWPIIFTVPLQSSLFSVVNVGGVWRWTAVQGVAWTLVGIYFLALMSIAGIWLYFLQRTTGLMWDPRSIADIVALLPRSNCLEAYQDTEVLANRTEFQEKLGHGTQRLGYWRTNNPAQELIYCIGEKGAAVRRYSKEDEKVQDKRLEQLSEKLTPDLEASSPQPLLSHGTNSSLLAKVYSPAIRFRYIPWFLDDTFILLWPIASFCVLLTLIIVSFLPSTTIRDGFPPLVDITTNSAGFSPANFLYSFIPSLLGILIYSSFESIILALSRLAPWAVLSNPSGSVASKSILLDYAASSSIPFSGVATAISNGHYLITLLSIVTPLTLLLPILAGGVFFPLQAIPSRDVLMFTNMPAFYTILAILILCVFSLIYTAISLLSRNGNGSGIGRRRYHLAHPVTCLGEIISFLYASDLIHDAAFRAVRSKVDLRTRLIERRERVKGEYGSQEVRYTFGIFKGDDGRSHLGASRVRIDRGSRPNLGAGEEGRSRSRFSI